MAKSCDISNKIIAGIVTSPEMLTKINSNINLIDSFDKQLDGLYKSSAKGVDNIIGRIEYAKKGAESNLFYQSVGSHILTTLDDTSILRQDKIKSLKESLMDIAPKYKNYIDRLDNLDSINRYIDGKVTNEDISNIIAFDIANLHKFDDFNALKKSSSNYVAYRPYGIGETGYNIYRDIFKDIVFDTKILKKEKQGFLDRIKEYAKVKTHNNVIDVNNFDNARDLINSATSIKELEENFLLSLKYIDKNNLDLFIKRVKEIKFKGVRSGKIEAFWEGVGEKFINPTKIQDNIRDNTIRNNIIVSGLFDEGLIDDYAKLIDDSAKAISKGDTITIGGYRFTKEDHGTLVRIIGLDNLEKSYIKRGEISIKQRHLRDLSSSDKNIVIDPNKSDADVDELFGKTYGDTIVKYINHNSKTAPVSDHYFYTEGAYISSSAEGQIDIYNSIKEMNSIDCGVHKGEINTLDGLQSKIKNTPDGQKLWIMLPDSRVYEELKNISIPKNKIVHFTFPQDRVSSFYINDGNVMLGITKQNIKENLYNAFNRFNIDIGIKPQLAEPNLLIQKILEKGFGTDVIQKATNNVDKINISPKDTQITVNKIVDLFGLYGINVSDSQKLLNMIKLSSRIDGNFVTELVDYSLEYATLKGKSIDFFQSEASRLLGEDVGNAISNKNIVDDYFNYKFATNLENKEFALNKFLGNFNKHGGDIINNIRKQTFILSELSKFLDVNHTGFKNFIELLNKSDVTEEAIRNDQFIYNTITKNIETGNENITDAITFYNYVKSDILERANKEIPLLPTEISEAVQKNINVPRKGNGFALVDNDMSMASFPTSMYEEAGKIARYEQGKGLTVSLDRINKLQKEGVSIIGDGGPLLEAADEFTNAVDNLFIRYEEYVTLLRNSGGTLKSNDFKKLYSSFEYELIKLENDMQSVLGGTLQKNDRLGGFYHSIGQYRDGDNFDLYIENLRKQRGTIKNKLSNVRSNIMLGVSDEGILPNGNILRGGVIEPGHNYALQLSKETGENAPYNLIRSMTDTDLRQYISTQKQNIENMIQSKGIVDTIYNAMSGTLRTYKFLDSYKLIDLPDLSKLPRALVDVNPSLASGGKSLAVSVNDDLIKNIYSSITDMYGDGHTVIIKGKKNILKMSGNIDANLENIVKIIEDEVKSILYQLDDTAKEGINVKGLYDSYTDIFLPYSSFVYVPQDLADSVAIRKGVSAGNTKDFMTQYISKNQTDLMVSDYLYDEKYIDIIQENVGDLEVLASDGIDKTYRDIVGGGFANVLFKRTRDILTLDSEGGRNLVKLYDIARSKGNKLANDLYNIVPKNMGYRISLSKGKGYKRAFSFDKDLLIKAQDTYNKLYTLTDTQLDDWIKLNPSTEGNIAVSVGKYFNAYKTALRDRLPENVLDGLKDTFLKIGRDASGNVDEAIANEVIKKEVYHLATIAENNAFLGIFNLDNAPETILKKINFKMYADGKIILDKTNNRTLGKGVETKTTKETLDMYKEFNKMFKTNLTEKQFEQSFESLFGGKLIQFNKYIEGSIQYLRKFTKLITPVIRVPYVIGMNVLTAFTTGFIPGIARGKQLVKGIGGDEMSAITRMVSKYDMLNEFFDVSSDGMKQLWLEADRLGGGNIVNGMVKSLASGQLGNTFNLLTTNTNNFLDIVLMGNYKKFAFHNAMQSLDGRKFASAIEFEKYLDGLSDINKQQALFNVEALANRGLYSVIAAVDGNMDKVVPLTGKTGRVISRVLSGVVGNISLLNGRGDGIVRWFSRGVLGSLDIGKYLLKNNFNADSFINVTKFIENTPEYRQRLDTMFADIVLFARGLRIARTYEDIYDDGSDIDIEDIIDSIGTFTTIGQGYSSSLAGQLISRPSSAVAEAIDLKRVTPTDDYNYGKIWASGLISTITSRFFAQLKYLKPYTLMVSQTNAYINKGMERNEAIGRALLNMISAAGSGMLKYMVSDVYDPDRLSYTKESRGDVPELMGRRITDDKLKSYAQTAIDNSTLGGMDFLRGLLKSNLIYLQLVKPINKILNGTLPSATNIGDITGGIPLFNTLYKGETPSVSYYDVNSIKSYFFDDSLLDPSTMNDWNANGVVSKGNAYFDDAISIIYDSMGKVAVNKMYEFIESQKGTEDTNVAKKYALSYMIDYVNTHDIGANEELMKSMLVQSSLSLNVNANVPKKKATDLDKQKYYLNEFNKRYQYSLKNNSNIATHFIIQKHNRENTDNTIPIYDNQGKIIPIFYDAIIQQAKLEKAFDENDIDYIDASFNPLVQIQRFNMWNIVDEKGNTNDLAMENVNKAMNYLRSTAGNRSPGQTVAMMERVMEYNTEGMSDAYNKDTSKYGGISAARETYIKNAFYYESALTDYILDMQTGLNNIKGDGSGGISLKVAQSKFKKIADEVDKIRGNFESTLKLPKWNMINFPLNSNDSKIFQAKPTQDYSAPKSSSIYSNSVTEGKTKDIKRTYKIPKQFKFKAKK